MTVANHQAIQKLIEEEGIFENYDIQNVGPASYELRIGSALSISNDIEYPIGVGEEFVLRETSHTLIGTMEKIKMPKYLVGTMFLKSRYGRGGFLPWGQGLVDPGYEGNLTISLLNLSQHPKIFVGGDKICHITFQYLETETDKPYDGVYKGSEGATGPKEKPPMKVLGDTFNAVVTGMASGIAQGAVTGGS